MFTPWAKGKAFVVRTHSGNSPRPQQPTPSVIGSSRCRSYVHSFNPHRGKLILGIERFHAFVAEKQSFFSFLYLVVDVFNTANCIIGIMTASRCELPSLARQAHGKIAIIFSFSPELPSVLLIRGTELCRPSCARGQLKKKKKKARKLEEILHWTSTSRYGTRAFDAYRNHPLPPQSRQIKNGDPRRQLS